jgi:hypothetical protein
MDIWVKIQNKLLYFAKIGEKYTIKSEDLSKIELKHKTKRFKKSRLENGDWLIWRVK